METEQNLIGLISGPYFKNRTISKMKLQEAEIKKTCFQQAIYKIEQLFETDSNGGVAGIRTLGKLSPTQPFQDCTLNRSDTTPSRWCFTIISKCEEDVKQEFHQKGKILILHLV